MSDVELQYRTHLQRPFVEDLKLGECIIRPCSTNGVLWWELLFYVAPDAGGDAELFGVPVNVHGAFTERAVVGRMWGFVSKSHAAGIWVVSPSINVLGSREIHPGAHVETSLWHHTPSVVGVPDGEPWIQGAP